MDTGTVWVIVLVVIIALGAIGAMWFYSQRRKSEELRDRFGSEYSRVLTETGDRRQAESELTARQERVERLAIRPLASKDREEFRQAWTSTQARFVDEPSEAIAEADRLITAVMQARGYPVGDFDQRVADISVDHPNVVENYRIARQVADANERGAADTEDLRLAMMRYRALFGELLEEEQVEETEVKR